ncbi:HAMP domain-containing protein [Rubrobacter indicoceani]|uniref:HAMP domain-containing protein n=1 Tax=Rubrobacter indicoceani TaxID=2051957 RepID=UPI000E5B7ADA|nr:HAMP domain-containing protein [Rubrobacter indicoceani]
MERSLKNRWNNRSLRLRMTLLYVVLLAVLLATLSVFIYLDLRAFLIDSTETRLRAQAKPTIERFLSVENPSAQEQATIPGVAENLSRNLTSRDTTATVLDSDGTYLANGRRLEEEIPAIAPSSKHVARALGGENEIGYTARDAAEERMLVLLIPLRSPENPETVLGVVQLNTPLAVTDQILFRERIFLGASMLLALLLGTLGGLAITGAALEPLRQIVSTCRRLASGDLGERVNLPHRKDEVGQLASAFDDMAERLEATFASQQRFSADAAHELRTPLTALGGSLEVLLRGSGDDPQAANRLIRGMHREVLRLGRVSEQLLDLSRLNSPLALNFREFPLRGFHPAGRTPRPGARHST